MPIAAPHEQRLREHDTPAAARSRPSRPSRAPSREWEAIALGAGNARSGQLELRRACACESESGACAACAESEPALQRAASGRGPDVAPPIVHEVLREAGNALDPATKAFFEPRLGSALDGVRVHTDARAADSARAVDARAYTVGRDIVFADGGYRPDTASGRRLLAHELAHTVQQGPGPAAVPSRLPVAAAGGELERAADRTADAIVSGRGAAKQPRSGASVQRELATPVPAVAPATSPALTADEIKSAIQYNRQFYDAANAKVIQDIVGTAVTGTWSAADIVAIADVQERFGLKKDGKVGADAFEFIQTEQSLEDVSTDVAECLTAFRHIVFPVRWDASPGPSGRTRIEGHHVVEARFSSRCDCSQFRYRQFIAGTATGTRITGASDPLAGSFTTIPGGRLPLAMQEDGMTQCPDSVRYGDRMQRGQERTTANCPENQYRDASGNVDQANGCVYRGEDFPRLTVSRMQTGDIVDLSVEFEGRIQHSVTPAVASSWRTIQTHRWTTIDTNVTTP